MDYLDIFKNSGDDAEDSKGGLLLLPAWGEREWQKLFAVTTPRSFKASEFIIRRGVDERSLYFVAAGWLEVGVTYANGVSISSLAKIGPGSVAGEQAFFDGQPRSANVFAVTNGELLGLTQEKFQQLRVAEPSLACDLLFALARILSLRLRHTTIRVEH